MTSKIYLTRAVLAGTLLASALNSHARSPLPGVNLLDNPEFTGQSSTFQNTDGPYATGWTYSPGYDFFSNPGLLVSQSFSTGDLYYYDIAFNLGTTPAEGGVDFALDWDGTFVQYLSLPPSSAWQSYSFQVTAEGPNSTFGLVGNTAFWSSLDNLDVSWNGGIDPPSAVPDSPLAFGLEAWLLVGLCGVAAFYGRPELRFVANKTT
jgi:hypothetical protein